MTAPSSSAQTNAPRIGIGSRGIFALEGASDSLSELLGPARARVVRALDQPQTTGDLAHELQVAPSTASEHLRGLVAARVVGRSRHGRRVLYHLTDEGRQLVDLMSIRTLSN